MRDVTPAMQAELARPLGTVAVWFVEADFGAPGVVRLWTGLGSKGWNGQTWGGGAQILELEVGQENADGTAAQTRFSLPPIGADGSTDLIAAALAAEPGRIVTVWKGALDADTGAVVADPVPLWAGRLDVPEIVEDDQRDGTRQVRVSCNAQELWGQEDRSNRYRATAASQLAWDDTDAGLADAMKWGDEKEYWGYFYFAEQHSP